MAMTEYKCTECGAEVFVIFPNMPGPRCALSRCMACGEEDKLEYVRTFGPNPFIKGIEEEALQGKAQHIFTDWLQRASERVRESEAAREGMPPIKPMRSREAIANDFHAACVNLDEWAWKKLTLEVLLDIRALLAERQGAGKAERQGR